MYQILKNWSQHLENNNWNRLPGGLRYVDDWKTITRDYPVLCSGDVCHENVRYWLNNNFPALYFARGYIGNHQHDHRDYWMHRITVRGWANFELKSIPYSRWNVLNLNRHPWKVKSVKKVLIAPSKSTTTYWSNQPSNVWAEEISKNFPGAEVKIRYKAGKPWHRWSTLFKDLDWADLVVSQSSAITAEAFWYGKKVISIEPCTTWAVGRPTFENWQDPKEPEYRDQWHEHVAWSQFTNNEINSGEAIDLVQQYHGAVLDIKHQYTYNFNKK
jgi:hypothetical protein